MDAFTRHHLAEWVGRTVWADDQTAFISWVERQDEGDLEWWCEQGWPSAHMAWEAAAGIR